MDKKTLETVYEWCCSAGTNIYDVRNLILKELEKESKPLLINVDVVERIIESARYNCGTAIQSKEAAKEIVLLSSDAVLFIDWTKKEDIYSHANDGSWWKDAKRIAVNTTELYNSKEFQEYKQSKSK